MHFPVQKLNFSVLCKESFNHLLRIKSYRTLRSTAVTLPRISALSAGMGE